MLNTTINFIIQKNYNSKNLSLNEEEESENEEEDIIIIEDRITRSEKIKITKVENQKILEQVLKERDERLKARANL